MSILQRYVSVIGGINLDVKGTSANDNASGDSHTGSIAVSAGGVARNMAENLARLGTDVKLFGCVGNDVFGEFVIAKTNTTGADTSNIRISDCRTSVYLSVANSSGNLCYAVNNTDNTADSVDQEYIRRYAELLAGSSIIVFDTNLQPQAISDVTEIANKNNIPVFADAVSSEKAERLCRVNGVIEYVSVNKLEYEILFGNSSECPAAAKFNNIIVRKGEKGADLITENGNVMTFDPLNVKVKDVNGAGDAFNAGFILSLLSFGSVGSGLRKASELGICAAAIALQSEETVSSQLSYSNLLELHSRYFKQ